MGNQQSHVFVPVYIRLNPVPLGKPGLGVTKWPFPSSPLHSTSVLKADVQKCDFCCLWFFSGFLDSGKRQRVLTGELIRGSQECGTFAFALASYSRCLLLLCCCSLPLWLLNADTQQSGLYGAEPSSRGGCGRGGGGFHKALLTKQQSEKMGAFAIRWVICLNCSVSPGRSYDLAAPLNSLTLRAA